MAEDAQPAGTQHDRVVNGLWAYAAGQSELGREFARHVGLPVTDSAAIVEILRAEDRGRPLGPARLAHLIGLTSGATSILLNRLEDAGHIARRRGHADRRAVTLHSTTAIHETAGAFFGPLRLRLDAVMDRYTSDHLDLIETFVDDVKEAVESYKPGTDPGPAPTRPARPGPPA